jgi:hypothetical protein
MWGVRAVPAQCSGDGCPRDDLYLSSPDEGPIEGGFTLHLVREPWPVLLDDLVGAYLPEGHDVVRTQWLGVEAQSVAYDDQTGHFAMAAAQGHCGYLIDVEKGGGHDELRAFARKVLGAITTTDGAALHACGDGAASAPGPTDVRALQAAWGLTADLPMSIAPSEAPNRVELSGQGDDGHGSFRLILRRWSGGIARDRIRHWLERSAGVKAVVTTSWLGHEAYEVEGALLDLLEGHCEYRLELTHLRSVEDLEAFKTDVIDTIKATTPGPLHVARCHDE